jgi:hypothetical protein
VRDLLWKSGRTITYGFLNGSVGLEDIVPYTAESDPIYKDIYASVSESGISNAELLKRQKDGIVKIVTERIAECCPKLLFKYVTDPSTADIKIMLMPNQGSWSYIGTASLGEEPSMQFGWYDASCIIHEWGHALGMIHEHQNPIGSTQVPWDEQKVYAYFGCPPNNWGKDLVDQNILESDYSVNQLNGSYFDPLSIMLYTFPACLTKNNVGTKRNLRLSGTDVLWLNKNYGPEMTVGPENSLTPTTQMSAMYKEWYGITIEESVKKSIEERKKFEMTGTTQSTCTDKQGSFNGKCYDKCDKTTPCSNGSKCDDAKGLCVLSDTGTTTDGGGETTTTTDGGGETTTTTGSSTCSMDMKLTCVKACTKTCPPGYKCNAEKKYCEPIPKTSCNSDEVLVNGMCLPLCKPTGCGTNQACEISTMTCVPMKDATPLTEIDLSIEPGTVEPPSSNITYASKAGTTKPAPATTDGKSKTASSSSSSVIEKYTTSNNTIMNWLLGLLIVILFVGLIILVYQMVYACK